jgi:hypothetical protein
MYIYLYSERENKIVLVSLSEGAMWGESDKQNVREWKILKQSSYMWI